MQRTPSISSISSSSSAEETIQIFIKTVSGDSSTPTPIPCTQKHKLTSPNSNPPNPPSNNNNINPPNPPLPPHKPATPHPLRLVHAGKHLSSTTTTLTAYGIPPNATLHMALPLRGGMPPKKIRCSFKQCRDAAQRIVGDCGFCSGHFCGRHRLLEDHKCEGLEDCKKESHERNADKLNSERTVAIKGV
ncbi:hypothetical protein GQ44DRAFT_748806 [Phaeosphaeriaceae sp. PMI808]|nr:hypothetical protein GQ44DRAFT_748806 [Phaeosphaeriaceae sp. PMI808]